MNTTPIKTNQIKRGRGRPKMIDDGTSTSVTITRRHAEHFRQVGDGNLSRGVRRVADAAINSVEQE